MKESTIARFHTASAVLTGATGLAMTGLALATTHGHPIRPDWPTAVVGLAVAGAGALSLVRRSLTSAVLARGAALSVLVPRLFVSGLSIFVHRQLPPGSVIALVALAAAGYLTSGPWVSRGRVARDFEPVAYRGLLLSGATATVATAFATAHLAIGAAYRMSPWPLAAFGAIAAMEFAAGFAVLRMRAWGVLLGVAVSLGLVAYSTAMPYYPVTRILAYGAGALLVAPLVLARWPMGKRRRGAPRVEPSMRIDVGARASDSVAVEEADDLEVTPSSRRLGFRDELAFENGQVR
ncbi:hypothetical protein AKJ09_09388 [Labilithrix luteola]|uniref:Uncharacterized protein n=1 Tax=Labilithrix luteola TaxID=1391654 RepID=A0A0K1QBF1_9BACT|nr:hypothetical protein [Labilithrix luteola]AKV02725.1 hypothetical protein AKJ09_09388 [Labilithrix luteola]